VNRSMALATGMRCAKLQTSLEAVLDGREIPPANRDLPAK
jgi:hypothetical protein